MDNHIFKGIPIYDKAVLSSLDKMFQQNKSHVLAALPWLVSELIEAVSFIEAIECVFENGGRRIYIGKTAEDLSVKLNFPVSQRLFDRIIALSDTNAYIEIPSPWGVSERIRAVMIKSATVQGKSREDIRRTFGVSHRSLAKR